MTELGEAVLVSEEMTLVPARFNERFIAYFLDVLPFAAGYCLAPRYAAAWLASYLGYQFIGNLTGATIGKRLMGLRVARVDGAPLGVFRSLLRALGYLASTPLFNFGFLVALAHPESRALHDLIAGSLVVEPRRKHPAEAGLLFVAAALTLSGLYGAMIYLNLSRPTPADVLAVEKARAGLVVMAEIQEAHRGAHGAYTDSLQKLAEASGDVEGFRAAMSQLFAADGFRIEAGNKGYRISGVARDRRSTVVAVDGPPPRPSR